jgi:general secretion pathway protein E
MSERFFNAYQVANLLDATPGAVVEWIQKGLLKVQQFPQGPLRISEQGLIQFLQNRGMDSEQALARLASYPADSGQAPAAEEQDLPTCLPDRQAGQAGLPRLDTSTPSPADRIDSSQPLNLRSESIEKMFPLEVESLPDVPSPYASAVVAEPQEEQPPAAETCLPDRQALTETPIEELPEVPPEAYVPGGQAPAEAASEELPEAPADELPEALPEATAEEETTTRQIENWLKVEDDEEPAIEDRPEEPSCEAVDQTCLPDRQVPPAEPEPVALEPVEPEPVEPEPVEPAERDALLGQADLPAEPQLPPAQPPEDVIVAAETCLPDRQVPAASQEESIPPTPEQPPVQAEEEVAAAAEMPAAPQEESIPLTPEPPPVQAEEEVAVATEMPTAPQEESVPLTPEQPPVQAEEEEEVAVTAETCLPDRQVPTAPQDESVPLPPEPPPVQAEEEVAVAAEMPAVPESESTPVPLEPSPEETEEEVIVAAETCLPSEQASPPDNAPPPSEDLPTPPAGTMESATAMVRDALARRASEIHIESTASALSVRLRTDGLLLDAACCDLQFPAGGAAPAMQQLSELAGIKLADARRPARGQVDMLIDGREVAVTVATCPTAMGQRMVVSLRDTQAASPGLSLLGLADEAESRLAGVLAGPAGLVLLLARPGAQRTQALEAIIAAMDAATRSLVAVARKPASSVAGLTPIITNPAADFSIAQAVRAAAEQDADAIILEDIPDAKTYPALLEAAELGRLVVAATWAASPAEAAVTLLDMGLKPWPLADNLKAIVAYVPLRKLCSDCRQPALPSDQIPAHLGLGDQDVGEAFIAGGCPKCCGSGYLGTVGCSSALLVDKDVAAAIRRGPSRAELIEAIEQAGAKPLFQVGLEMVRTGMTSLEELTRALPQ